MHLKMRYYQFTSCNSEIVYSMMLNKRLIVLLFT